jgi:hypothetical protein
LRESLSYLYAVYSGDIIHPHYNNTLLYCTPNMSSPESSNDESSSGKKRAVDSSSRAVAADAVETLPKRMSDASSSGDSIVPLPILEQATAKKIAEDFVKSIMMEYEEIPESNGMFVLRNVVQLETGKPCDVVIRSITVPFWQACLDKAYTGSSHSISYRVCAIGTPGIGKTVSTSILIRMLLKRGRTVVYLIRTKKETGWYYEFTPSAPTPGCATQATNVDVKVYPENQKHDEIDSLRHHLTYYVVDPGNTEDSCDPESDFKARVIIVSSPDERHWGESNFDEGLDKRVEGFFRYFPLWSGTELLNARPILGPSFTDNDIIARHGEVGGVPRHIFANDSDYEKALDLQEEAVDKMPEKYAMRIAAGRLNAIENPRKEDVPRSPLLGYRLAENDNGLFFKFDVILISSSIECKVYSKFIKILWPIIDGSYMVDDSRKMNHGW